MARPRNAIPSRELSIMLDEQIATRLELHLWSEAEQRLPYAARQKFITARLREYFERKSLDLAPYFHDLPTGSQIHGSPAVVGRLQLALEDLVLAGS